MKFEPARSLLLPLGIGCALLGACRQDPAPDLQAELAKKDALIQELRLEQGRLEAALAGAQASPKCPGQVARELAPIKQAIVGYHKAHQQEALLLDGEVDLVQPGRDRGEGGMSCDLSLTSDVSKVLFQDVNGDGLGDALVEFACSGYGNMIGSGNGYLLNFLVTNRTGTLEAVPIDCGAPLSWVAPGRLRCKQMEYGPDDPRCCPSVDASYAILVAPDGSIASKKSNKEAR